MLHSGTDSDVGLTHLEIFGHLHPYDLLRLTRTTKEFRRILLHRSSISTWKASFEHVPSLPACPPEMCEPAWANLAFSPHCHVCLWSSFVRLMSNLAWTPQVLQRQRRPPRGVEISCAHLCEMLPVSVSISLFFRHLRAKRTIKID